MEPFNYVQASDNAGAVELAARGGGAKFIAGGTNLVDLMKLAIETPHQIIDINALALQKIEALPSGGLRIGALVRNSDLAYDDTVRRRYPVLSEALLSGASPQLRNMATVGGNLMQRTRCPYFYDIVFACNKRVPGSGCSAMNGYNRSHAILGVSDKCIATHPSDMCVALAALDAIVHLQGPKGARSVPMIDFHLLPGETPERETVLERGELIVAVELPAMPFAARSHYVKARDRASYEFALASVAVALDLDGATIRAARVAFGGIGTKPWRSREAEQVLTGATANESAYRRAADAAVANAQTRQDNAFKPELARRTLIRALTSVVAKTA